MPDEKAKESLPDAAESLHYLNDIYSERYASVTSEIRRVVEDIEDLNRASATLSNLGSLNGKGMLVPAGKYMLVPAIAEPNGKVLVEVGAGFLVEKESQAAEQFISEMVKSRSDYLNRLTAEKDKLENALLEISFKLSEQQDLHV